jgi:hypothetical protein
MPHYCNKEEKEVDLWFKEKRFKCERPGKTSLDGNFFGLKFRV